MLQGILNLGKITKLKLILASIVFTISSMAAPFGVLGVQSASAAQGDWWTQYSRTADASGNYCVNYQYHDQRGYCVRWEMVDWDYYGSDSRRFTWRIKWSNMTCYRNYYIGNNYYIWHTVTYGCFR